MSPKIPEFEIRLIYSYSNVRPSPFDFVTCFRMVACTRVWYTITSLSLCCCFRETQLKRRRKKNSIYEVPKVMPDACRLHMCCARGRHLNRRRKTLVQITWWRTLIFVNIISQISTERPRYAHDFAQTMCCSNKRKQPLILVTWDLTGAHERTNERTRINNNIMYLSDSRRSADTEWQPISVT